MLFAIDTPAELTWRFAARSHVAAAERAIAHTPAPGEPFDAVHAARALEAGHVVFAHGYGASRGSAAAIAKAAQRDGFTLHAFDDADHAFASLATTTDHFEQFLREAGGGSRVHLVGHSKGGLVVQELARRVVAGESTAVAPESIASIATMGTPNHGMLGTNLPGFSIGAARLSSRFAGPTFAAVGELYPGPVVDALRGAQLERRFPFTSIYARVGDTVVSPASAHVGGAHNVELGTTEHPVGHMQLLTDDRAYESLRDHWLAAATPLG